MWPALARLVIFARPRLLKNRNIGSYEYVATGDIVRVVYGHVEDWSSDVRTLSSFSFKQAPGMNVLTVLNAVRSESFPELRSNAACAMPCMQQAAVKATDDRKIEIAILFDFCWSPRPSGLSENLGTERVSDLALATRVSSNGEMRRSAEYTRETMISPVVSSL